MLPSASDEVNLHSRFLAALLDHRKPGEAERKNLEEFLRSGANVENFHKDGVAVERERHTTEVSEFFRDTQALSFFLSRSMDSTGACHSARR
ncbi:hypothetical protein [Candidatus Rariloculus sp.]|uniref:hypothetical protein n=1 Tax=Candidatus Rariloculus sp. TaxID=3101265 RepID=UPI003D10C13B